MNNTFTFSNINVSFPIEKNEFEKLHKHKWRYCHSEVNNNILIMTNIKKRDGSYKWLSINTFLGYNFIEKYLTSQIIRKSNRLLFVRRLNRKANYHGVMRSASGQRFYAICRKGYSNHLQGPFLSETVAAKAYDKLAKKLPGNRVQLNFSTWGSQR